MKKTLHTNVGHDISHVVLEDLSSTTNIWKWYNNLLVKASGPNKCPKATCIRCVMCNIRRLAHLSKDSGKLVAAMTITPSEEYDCKQ
jgi:hypothetical protein